MPTTRQDVIAKMGFKYNLTLAEVDACATALREFGEDLEGSDDDEDFLETFIAEGILIERAA